MQRNSTSYALSTVHLLSSRVQISLAWITTHCMLFCRVIRWRCPSLPFLKASSTGPGQEKTTLTFFSLVPGPELRDIITEELLRLIRFPLISIAHLASTVAETGVLTPFELNQLFLYRTGVLPANWDGKVGANYAPSANKARNNMTTECFFPGMPFQITPRATTSNYPSPLCLSTLTQTVIQLTDPAQNQITGVNEDPVTGKFYVWLPGTLNGVDEYASFEQFKLGTATPIKRVFPVNRLLNSACVVLGGYAYFQDEQSMLHKLDIASGEDKASLPVPGRPGPPGQPIAHTGFFLGRGNRLYYLGRQGVLYGLHPRDLTQVKSWIIPFLSRSGQGDVSFVVGGAVYYCRLGQTFGENGSERFLIRQKKSQKYDFAAASSMTKGVSSWRLVSWCPSTDRIYWGGTNDITVYEQATGKFPAWVPAS